MVGGTTAALVGAGVGASLGVGIAGAIKQHRAYKELQREREAVLAEVKKEGLKKQAALDNAARKVGRRAQSRSLFSPSGDFMGVLDEGAPVFGV
jgi:hypothetical protein